MPLNAGQARPGDQLLADRLQRGDRTVFGEIADGIGKKVVAALRRTYHSIEADDLLQETLLRLWKRRCLYDPEKGSLQSFVYIIAENVAKDMLKSRWHKGREAERPLGHGAAGLLASTRNDPASLAEAAAGLSGLEQSLVEVLGDLPDSHRRILLAWAKGGGEAWATDLAAELQWPAGRIRVYRKRILERVMSALEKQGHVLPQQRAASEPGRAPAEGLPTRNTARPGRHPGRVGGEKSDRA
jgi:RNA polymerase sigma-70 factor, ECF subfamily